MLQGAMEAQDRVGLMLNVRREDLQRVLAVLPALQKPTISHLSDEEWLAVNTVIDESRRVEGDSAAQGSACRGDCRVSAEQGGVVMRILSGRPAAAMVQRLSARGVRLTSLEPKVRTIVNRVRRGGDKALRGYAQRWDGLASKQPFRVPAAEFERAWKAASPQLRDALSRSRTERSPLLPIGRNLRNGCERTGEFRLDSWAIPLDSVGCYVPGGRHPLGIDVADDGDPGAVWRESRTLESPLRILLQRC